MPRPLVNIVGKRFGKLVAVEVVKTKKRSLWKCICDCGKDALVTPSNLANGHTLSCGCLRDSLRAINGAKNATHGHCRGGKLTPEYISHRAAWQRYYDPKLPQSATVDGPQ